MRTIAVALTLAAFLGLEPNDQVMPENELTPLEQREILDSQRLPEPWIIEPLPYYPQPWNEPLDEWEV